MKRKMTPVDTQTFIYFVTARGSGLIRIGLARDPLQRLRELQVGSPLKLDLAHTHACVDRLAGEAIVEELERRFAGRREHGHWYRLDAALVRSALTNPTTLAAPATAAAARDRAAAEEARREAAFKRRRGRNSRARTQKELAYQRRRERERARIQKQAARLLASGRTQTEAAAAIAVTPRTLRNWKHAPAFERAFARERARLASPADSAPPAFRRPRRHSRSPLERAPVQAQPQPAVGSSRQPDQSNPPADDSLAQIEAWRFESYARWLDSNDARRGELTPGEIRARKRKQEQQ